MVGVLQAVYIALVNTCVVRCVSADVRAISAIGVPLAIHHACQQHEAGIAAAAAHRCSRWGHRQQFFLHGTATMDLQAQHIGWKAERRKLKTLASGVDSLV